MLHSTTVPRSSTVAVSRQFFSVLCGGYSTEIFAGAKMGCVVVVVGSAVAYRMYNLTVCRHVNVHGGVSVKIMLSFVGKSGKNFLACYGFDLDGRRRDQRAPQKVQSLARAQD